MAEIPSLIKRYVAEQIAKNLSVTANVVSNALSVETVNRISADNALSNAISAVGGVNAVSQALSVETVNRISADNILSTNINTVSNAVSIVSQALSAETANRISADNALSVNINTVSNAVSIVSQALSVETANRISADNALSNTISAYAALTVTETNKRITRRIRNQISAASGVLTPNMDLYDTDILSAQGAALSLAAPTGTPTAEQHYELRIKDNGTARSINFNAIYRQFVSAPTTTVVSKQMRIGLIYNADDVKYDIVAVVNEV